MKQSVAAHRLRRLKRRLCRIVPNESILRQSDDGWIDPNATINWKMADGTFVALDAQAITAVAMAVRAHVQTCFDREAELKVRIKAAATVDEISALDLNTGWP